MVQIRKYEEAFAGKVQPKLRQVYNLPNLVFSGMVDTLESDFDDEISLKFKEKDPADYEKVKKINAFWKAESNKMTPNARWQLKMRWDKHLAIMGGRSFQKTYAESSPDFKMNFDIVDYRYFHAEPKGGGNLENHLFCGEEGIFRTKEQLEKGAESGLYDKEQVKLIIERSQDREFKPELLEFGDKMSRFKAAGLETEANNYVGQAVFNLCEWALTYQGNRYYLLFDPWSKEWLRCEKLADVFSNDLWPWTSWATHPDPKVFWSKSYADDLYPIGDAVKQILDQEFTNRQKLNMGAKAYDVKYFPDAAKLDMAQYRPDALVPVTVPEGHSISDGIYNFTTPELKGSIDLINWIEQDLGKNSGITEISQAPSGAKGKSATIQYSLLQQATKRIGHKAKNYIECYQEIGLRFVNGLIDHLTEAQAIEMIGKDGMHWDLLTRGDLRLKKPYEVEIFNQTEEDKMNVLGKDQKIAALKMIIENPNLLQINNPKVVNEMIWKHVGGMNDDFIQEVMDVQNYSSKEVMAQADLACKLMAKGKEPEMCYDATPGWYMRIMWYEKRHQEELKEKSLLFFDYLEKHVDIIKQNMQSTMLFQQAQKTGQQSGEVPQGQPQGQPASQPQTPISKQQIPVHQRPDMNLAIAQ